MIIGTIPATDNDCQFDYYGSGERFMKKLGETSALDGIGWKCFHIMGWWHFETLLATASPRSPRSPNPIIPIICELYFIQIFKPHGCTPNTNCTIATIATIANHADIQNPAKYWESTLQFEVTWGSYERLLDHSNAHL